MSIAAIGNANYTYISAGAVTEAVVSGAPCILIAIIPDATTLGTVTLRDTPTAAAGTAMSISAIGLTQPGKYFGNGIKMNNGLTVQLSNAGDKVGVVWAPYQT
jgi:hypothetical protein